MSMPTGLDVQAVDPVLTNLLVGYMQNDSRFVADRVFPGISVDKDSGTYYIMTKKYFFSDDLAPRAYGEQFPIADFNVSSTTYTTAQFALGKRIADEVRANSQLPLDLETATVQWLAQKALIRKERGFASDFVKASVWATDATPTDWDDYTSGDPITDILTGNLTISHSTGYYPNTLVLGLIVHNALVNHPDLIDRLKYVAVAGVNQMEAAMGNVLGIENYLVSKASYNSANIGQTGTNVAIIDDDAVLMYVTPTPGIMTASAGYTFNWAPGGGLGSILPMHRDGENQADLIRVKMQIDQKAVATDCGYTFIDIV